MIFLIFYGYIRYVQSRMFLKFFQIFVYVINQFKLTFNLFDVTMDVSLTLNYFLTYFILMASMKIRFSYPYTSKQNGKFERAIRTINNILRTLLSKVSLPSNFWFETLHLTVHTLNLLPTTLNFRTPFDILIGFFPPYTHL